MGNKILPLIASTLLLSSCGLTRGSVSSSVESSSSSESVDSSASESSEPVASSESTSEEISSESTSSRKEVPAWKVSEALADSLINLASKEGLGLRLTTNGSTALSVKDKGELTVGFEDAYADLRIVEDKGKEKIVLVEEDKEGGIEEVSMPYLHASASLGARKSTFSIALADGDKEGDSLSVSFANREISAYLDGGTAYLDLSDLNTLTQVAKYLDIDIPSLNMLSGELGSMLFGQGIIAPLEPIYGDIGHKVASLYEEYLSTKESLLDSDPVVIEMALGLLTEYAKFYIEDGLYSIEIPADYENLTTVLETVSDLGLFGERIEEGYDFKALLEKLLPGLDEESGKLSLTFTDEEIIGLDAQLKTGLDVGALFGEEELLAKPSIDISLHLEFEEVRSIDYPDFSDYIPIA